MFRAKIFCEIRNLPLTTREVSVTLVCALAYFNKMEGKIMLENTCRPPQEDEKRFSRRIQLELETIDDQARRDIMRLGACNALGKRDDMIHFHP